jgi:hypothetical protein
MLGYPANVKLETTFYNLVHTSVLPIDLSMVALLLPAVPMLPYVLIWISHIGLTACWAAV